MTEYWGGWPQDQPDVDGLGADGTDDPGVEGFAPDVDDPVEGFGDADLDPYAAEPGDDSGPYLDDDPWTGGDDYPDGEVGFGAADEPHGADPLPETGSEPTAEAGFGPVGTDPDRGPYGDPAQWPLADPGAVEGFGPAPEPVDGFPWVDPDLLGSGVDGPAPEPAAPVEAAPRPDDLADYAAARLPDDGDPWSALAASDDPATSALARFWGTESR